VGAGRPRCGETEPANAFYMTERASDSPQTHSRSVMGLQAGPGRISTHTLSLLHVRAVCVATPSRSSYTIVKKKVVVYELNKSDSVYND
jgi:hypothetical protein